MTNYTEWLPTVLKAGGMAITGIALMWLAARSNKRKREEYFGKETKPVRSYTERNPPLKKLEDLTEGETIIVAEFTKQNDPIVQYVEEFQKEFSDIEGDCFVLWEAEPFNLKKGKTYLVRKIGRSKMVHLEQVAMYIDADVIL